MAFWPGYTQWSTSVKWFCPTCTGELHASPDPDRRMATQEAKMDTLMQTVVVTLQTQNAAILKILAALDVKVEERVRENFGEERDRESRKDI